MVVEQPTMLKALSREELQNLLALHLNEAKSREQEMVQLLLEYLDTKDDNLLKLTCIKFGSLTHELSSGLNQLMWQIGLRYVLPDMKSTQEFINNFETKHDFPIMGVGAGKAPRLYSRIKATSLSIEPLRKIHEIIERVQPKNKIRRGQKNYSYLQILKEVKNSKAHTMIVTPTSVGVSVRPKTPFGNEVSDAEMKEAGLKISTTWVHPSNEQDSLVIDDDFANFPTYFEPQCLFVASPLEIRKFYFTLPDYKDDKHCIFCCTKGMLNNVQHIMYEIVQCLES